MYIPEHSALLVIDLQDDDKNDGIPVMKGSATYQNAPKIIRYFREKKLPVIQVREVHRADHCDYGRELDGTE